MLNIRKMQKIIYYFMMPLMISSLAAIIYFKPALVDINMGSSKKTLTETSKNITLSLTAETTSMRTRDSLKLIVSGGKAPYEYLANREGNIEGNFILTKKDGSEAYYVSGDRGGKVNIEVKDATDDLKVITISVLENNIVSVVASEDYKLKLDDKSVSPVYDPLKPLVENKTLNKNLKKEVLGLVPTKIKLVDTPTSVYSTSSELTRKLETITATTSSQISVPLYFGGSSVASNAISGSCGSSNSIPSLMPPVTNLCSTGNPSVITGGNTTLISTLAQAPWTWTCVGSGGGSSSSCSAPIIISTPPAAIDGSCGSSSNQSLSQAPTTNLCSAGAASLISGSGPWTWTCSGSNGGAVSSQCLVNHLVTINDPKIFWSSYPVKTNETVSVRGYNFSTTSSILIGSLTNADSGSPLFNDSNPSLGEQITSIQSNKNSASFIIPSNFSNGVYAYKIKNPSGLQSTIQYLNKPDVWFISGDNGGAATPGGWLELYGRSISLAPLDFPQIALVSSEGIVYKVVATQNNPYGYSARFSIPTNIPEGVYTLYAHNSYGGSYGWSKFEWRGDEIIKTVEIKNSIPWPTNIYNINSMLGTTTDDKLDSATALAKANGGGIIEFPAGNYNLTKPMILPNKTLLRGAGKSSTFIRWGGVITDTRTNPADACAGAKGTFALVTSDFITYTPTGPLCASFSIENVTLGHLTSDDYICIKRAFTANEKAWFRNIACVAPNLPQNAISAKGTGMWMKKTVNTEISDSTFDYIYGMDFNGNRSNNSFVRIERNIFRWRFAPYTISYNNNNFIIDSNQLIMAGTESGNGVAGLADVGEAYASINHNLRDVYFGSNISTREDTNPIPNNSTVDMTLDSNGGAYFGKINSVSGTTLNLAGITSNMDQYGHPPVVKGAAVQIVSGKGLGQSRVLQSPSTLVNSITIDEPWDVEPDSTSWINISDQLGRFLFIGNTFTNHPRIQFYFPSADVIFANNTLGVNGPKTSLLLWTGKTYPESSFATAPFFQVLDNIITRAGVAHENVVNALQPLAPGYDGDTVLSQVYRNNISDGAPFTMRQGKLIDGLLIEKNRSLSSIFFSNPASSTGIIIRDNKTNSGTTTPVTLDVSGNAIIIP
jgi:hypothetical protein